MDRDQTILTEDGSSEEPQKFSCARDVRSHSNE